MIRRWLRRLADALFCGPMELDAFRADYDADAGIRTERRS